MDFLTYKYTYLYILIAVGAVLFLLWSYRGRKGALRPSEAISITKDKTGTFLDVRPESEVASGTVPQAKAIPLDELESKIQALYKITRVVLVTSNNKQIAEATKILKANGIEEVYTLTDGLEGWKKEDLPLGKPSKYNLHGNKRSRNKS